MPMQVSSLHAQGAALHAIAGRSGRHLTSRGCGDAERGCGRDTLRPQARARPGSRAGHALRRAWDRCPGASPPAATEPTLPSLRPRRRDAPAPRRRRRCFGRGRRRLSPAGAERMEFGVRREGCTRSLVAPGPRALVHAWRAAAHLKHRAVLHLPAVSNLKCESRGVASLQKGSRTAGVRLASSARPLPPSLQGCMAWHVPCPGRSVFLGGGEVGATPYIPPTQAQHTNAARTLSTLPAHLTVMRSPSVALRTGAGSKEARPTSPAPQ